MGPWGMGQLKTPWNTGKWGALPDKPATLFADFGGAQHEMTFAGLAWAVGPRKALAGAQWGARTV